MSIRFEWTTADDAAPQLVEYGQTPAGEPVDLDNPFHEEVVTADYAIVMGDGAPIVIEGTAAELEALFLRCARMAADQKEN